MRLVSALGAFLFVGLMTGIVFIVVGEAAGWLLLAVHSDQRGPLWWRVAYLLIMLCGTAAAAVVAARSAWRSGRE
jgi:hypothetical protein